MRYQNIQKRLVTASCAVLMVGLMATISQASLSIIGLNPMSGNSNVLDITTSPFSVSTIGSAGFGSLSGLDFQPGTGTLYASSGFNDGGRLFTIDPTTGMATLVGATGFDAVAGLAFDQSGTLYGSAFVSGLSSQFPDQLITIDPSTGLGTLVGGIGGTQGPLTMDSLAVDPTSNILYGAGGFDSGAVWDELLTINKTTGAATSLGVITEFGTGAPMPNFIAGMAFDHLGNLYGSIGFGDGRIVSIDIDALTFTFLGDAAVGSVSDIAIAPIPEPTAFLVWSLLGLSAVGVKCRRNRKV